MPDLEVGCETCLCKQIDSVHSTKEQDSNYESEQVLPLKELIQITGSQAVKESSGSMK